MKDLIRCGYDAISYAYRGDEEDGRCAAYHAWLDELEPRLAGGSAVLELGCGCGVPVARRLAVRYAYTGVDFSPVQTERAQRNAPQGRFLCADISDVRFPEAGFAAIVSFYTIIHVPLAEQPGLFRRVCRWLQPGGYLLATVGHWAWTGIEENWLGAPMAWSHADEATYLRWLAEAGLAVLWTRFIPEGTSGHTLLLAQRPCEPDHPDTMH
jgi:SAM-dependent methyltransferase